MSSEREEPAHQATGPVRPATKSEVHVHLVGKAFGEADPPTEIGIATLDDGGVDCLHQQGAVLVRDAYLHRIADIVGGGRPLDALIDGVTLYSLQGAELATVPAALEEIDSRLGVGVASPNHVLSISPVHMCPADEPEQVPADAAPDPGIGPAQGGNGVFVHVADTGLLADATAHSWLAGVTGEEDPLPGAAEGGEIRIPPYTGHGTFIAGLIRCMAPSSQVQVINLLCHAGAELESEIVKRLDAALSLGPDVISLSAGGTSRNDLPLLGFEAFWERYRHYKGVVLVAAAGNNGNRRPFWPAAFPQVVSVGALAASGSSRASFSGYGSWVDVYAPGEELVNAYATGTYLCGEPPHTGEKRQFLGMAKWSGTSFSTALVAGLVATRMSGTGENGRQAADALLTLARAQAIPGVGPVLHPSDTGENRHNPPDRASVPPVATHSGRRGMR